jgi:hypothetical protein
MELTCSRGESEKNGVRETQETIVSQGLLQSPGKGKDGSEFSPAAPVLTW